MCCKKSLELFTNSMLFFNFVQAFYERKYLGSKEATRELSRCCDIEAV